MARHDPGPQARPAVPLAGVRIVKWTRFDFYVSAATMATILLGMDWPFTVRVVLCPVAVGLWLLAVIRRVR